VLCHPAESKYCLHAQGVHSGYHSQCPKIAGKTTVLLLKLHYLTTNNYDFYKDESKVLEQHSVYWSVKNVWCYCMKASFRLKSTAYHTYPMFLGAMFMEVLPQNVCNHHKITLLDGNAPPVHIQQRHIHCGFTTDPLKKNVSTTNMWCITDYCPMMIKWHATAHSSSYNTQTKLQKTANRLGHSLFQVLHTLQTV
jgi:hypothetical protein